MAGHETLRCVPWQDLDDRLDAWNSLVQKATEPNPFFEPWYLLPSLRHIASDAKVRILCFERGGELLGLMPIMRHGRYYRWPVPNLANWLHPNCFSGAPPVAAGYEIAFWKAVVAWADKHAGTSLFLHLRGMTLNGPLHGALTAVTQQQRRQIECVKAEERALLCADATPQAYFEASLSGKKRKELRRQANRLAEEGTVEVQRRHDDEGLAQWCEQFLALEGAGWKGAAGSALASASSTRNLFVEALGGAAARGRLERLSLLLDGRPIAMLATFMTPPGAFSFKTAFDERYSRYSPGVLLQKENLDILARSDIEWSDSCASADHPMIDHLWRERRPVGSLSIAIGGALRRTIFRQFVRAEMKRSHPGSPS